VTVLLYALGVVVFALAIVISIGLHELGHLTPAKRFGCRVSQYFIGFGPTVWSRRIGETEYGLKAVPLGGYVKIVGMLPPGAHDLAEEVEQDAEGNPVVRIRKSNTGLFTQLVSDARAAEWELVRPEDGDRLFYTMPWWKKVIVMAGGPTVNVVLAFLCFLAVFSIYGQRSEEIADGRPVAAAVSQCVLPWAERARDCRPDDRPAPAAEMGLEPGDRVLAFNGTPVADWEELQTLIRTNTAPRSWLTVERTVNGSTVTKDLKKVPSVWDHRSADPDDTSLDAPTKRVGFLGLTPTTETVVTKGGPLFTLEQMGHMTKESVKVLAQLPVKVWGVAEAIVGVEERAADSPMSIVGGGRLAGEVATADEWSWADKTATLFMIIGGFNLFIGIFNFVPLLPLDGGHIASALWEGLRRAIARLRRRPDPGYVDAAKLLPVAYVVMVCFLVMSAILIVGDIVAPLHLST